MAATKTINQLALITNAADGDRVPIYDASSGQMVAITILNLQGAFLGSYIRKDGTEPLTGDWDIGDGRTILADEIRARDAAGLKLFNDEGLGLHVLDNGNIGFSRSLQLASNMTVDGIDIDAFKSAYDSHQHDTRYYTKSQAYTQSEVDAGLNNRALASHTHALGNLSNVSSSSPGSGQALIWNGSVWAPGTLSSGPTQHHELSGLGDDDHPHYFRADGSRKMQGPGSNEILIGTGSNGGSDAFDIQAGRANKPLVVRFSPSGTGNASYFALSNASDFSNYSYLQVGAVGNAVRFQVLNVGTPATFLSSYAFENVNVGIKTTLPQAPLHVYRSGAGSVSVPGETVIMAESGGFGYLTLATPTNTGFAIRHVTPSSSNSAQIAFFHFSTGLSDMRFELGGTARAILTPNQFAPAVDQGLSAGTAAARFSSVWAATGTIQTSDESDKRDIADSDLGLDFIRALRPVRGRWRNVDLPELTETRTEKRKKMQTVRARGGGRGGGGGRDRAAHRTARGRGAGDARGRGGGCRGRAADRGGRDYADGQRERPAQATQRWRADYADAASPGEARRAGDGGGGGNGGDAACRQAPAPATTLLAAGAAG